MTSITDWISDSIPDIIMEDAAAWMALLDSERCNAADRVAFARWLDEDSQHRWAFEELSEIWARLHMLVDVGPMLEHPKVSQLPAAHQGIARPEQKAPRDWSALWVVAIIAAGVGAHFAGSAPVQSYATAAGEIISVELDDGSRLELNAQTRLDVTFDERSRHIELMSGEVVFHVAHDERPFVVAADQATVAARGTQFSMKNTTENLEVAVLEGAVAVTSSGRNLPLSEYDGDLQWSFRDDTALLGAGDIARVSANALRLSVADDDTLQRNLSWRDGVVEFHEQPLSTVVAEMRRYVDINVHIADERIARSRVSATFTTGDSDAYLARLSDLDNVDVEMAGVRWVVLRVSGTNQPE